MKQIILGTAGHIDHGKTSLIKAVTGIDTDRLKEEKKRGITIELGFASLELPSGQRIGIVDVPGHEKFVKNMVAGATGIDIVAMVIAADEGVMPQTREHMEICSLLNIKNGLVVLTKTDLVDEEFLELAKEDIREFTAGTFLEGASVIPVSSQTGEGLEGFKKMLDEISTSVSHHSSTDLFRLPVDRVFTMKGFGTVITGTLASGSIKTGDTIMVYPSGIVTKVRGIQVHNESVDIAESGLRTAINFQSLDRMAVSRGDVLAAPDSLITSYMSDVSFNYLASNKKPIKNRARVRFHTGTSEVLGNLILLETEELQPGESAVAQIRLDSPVAIVKDDRYVIRSYSPVRTIGGGFIINPVPQKHKRLKPEVTARLKELDGLGPDEMISHYVDDSGYKGVSFSTLKVMTNLPGKQLEKSIQSLLSKKVIVQTNKENQVYIHKNSFDKIKGDALKYLESYHLENPLKPGMAKEELKSKFPAFLDSKLFNIVLNQMVKDKQVIQEEDVVRSAAHTVSLGADQTDVREKILKVYQESGLTPPYFKELSKTLDIDQQRAKDVLMLLVKEGMVIKVKDDLYFNAESVKKLKEELKTFLSDKGEITTPQFKDMTGASRKYVIPLLEYFDSTNVTIRIGDNRKLRKG
ncbi:MAG: selenocysteine-specific translation elongation factor [Deltaproteobacteria bacterium]|nr:selenocysteine-specific translation elongation factor [Deltaproteobacteria bacterium]